ncbi:MAG: ComEC/Rec2 family competence protein, partial [Bacillota bacterium]|nr:ComEC/Rec2 family competence protein [Bacillota bacterium]
PSPAPGSETASAPSPAPAPGRDLLRVFFLDVGQGDAILVRTPGGRVLLVDGGPPEAGPRLVRDLKRLGVKRIDVLLSTHPHADHIGGLLEVLPAFPVGVVYDPGVVHTTSTFERYLRLIEQKGIPFRLARRGVELPLEEGIKAQVLWPGAEAVARAEEEGDLNAASAVVRLTYGQVALLLTVDIEREQEEALLRQSDVRAQILKVAHHGSNSSTGSTFLARVGPRVAVIQVGRDNPYGHPSRQVLARLAARGVEVWRTDQNGTVILAIDGSTWQIKAERGEAGGSGERGDAAGAGRR